MQFSRTDVCADEYIIFVFPHLTTEFSVLLGNYLFSVLKNVKLTFLSYTGFMINPEKEVGFRGSVIDCLLGCTKGSELAINIKIISLDAYKAQMEEILRDLDCDLVL